MPTADDAGQLVLAWGEHRWTADYGFGEQPRGPQPVGAAGLDGRREFDSDLSAFSRLTTLSKRQETALARPDGSQISMLYGKTINADHDDFYRIESAAEGDVIRLSEAAVIRLRTEVSLDFGGAAVPTDNLAPDFPGSYGLWIKRSAGGWRLVFNNEPDSWGTQHNPAFDTAEIGLTYSRTGQSRRSLGAVLVPTGEDSGTLVIHWGLHEWAADFTVVPR